MFLDTGLAKVVFVSSSENDVSIDAKSPSYLSHTVEVISGASQLLSVPSFDQIWWLHDMSPPWPLAKRLTFEVDGGV